MISLADIQAPIATEIQEFEKRFHQVMESDFSLLNQTTKYLLKQKGKQMRPMLVLLTAGIQGGVTEKTYRGATLIELLHTATLVHDDVVDNAAYRRNSFSINAVWKNKVAVLLGDHLLTKGLLLSVAHKDYDLLEIVSEAVKEMSEGELLQIEKAKQLNMTESVYFEIIRKKTASLIAACFAVGACSAGVPTNQIEKMHSIGEKVGMAFQIRDDLLDYGTHDIGKPLGIDIREKKITLPLICALKKASWWDRQKVLHILRNHGHKSKKVAQVIEFVKSLGGISYAQKVMNNYYKEAFTACQALEDSVYKKALSLLIQYTIERCK